MSMHPNVVLMAVLEPDGLSRATMKAIAGEDVFEEVHGRVKVGGEGYWPIVMEDSYDKGFQISAPVGSLVFLDMVTYGFGDVISWESLEEKKRELETWAKEMAEKHHCRYSIHITANYW